MKTSCNNANCKKSNHLKSQLERTTSQNKDPSVDKSKKANLLPGEG